MWKREESPRSNGSQPVAAPASPPPPVMADAFEPERKEPKSMKDEQVMIGKSILIKGELSGDEDLTVEGQVEGKIELRDHVLTIGANGRIKAQVFAKSIVVLGNVIGNLTATERVTIRDHGSVEGDIVAPGVAIAEGAYFRGSIDMQRKEQPATPSLTSSTHRPEVKPAVTSVVGELAGV